MAPMAICSNINPMTTKKYLAVAFIEGLGTALRSGSRFGTTGSGASGRALWYHTMPAMPASSRMTLAMVHIEAAPDSVLPTAGSCGQLLVYESPVSPGRSVAADHADQKKNAASALRSSARGRAFD